VSIDACRPSRSVIPKLFLIAYHFWVPYCHHVPHCYRQTQCGKYHSIKIKQELTKNAAWAKCLREIMMVIFRKHQGTRLLKKSRIYYQNPKSIKHSCEHIFCKEKQKVGLIHVPTWRDFRPTLKVFSYNYWHVYHSLGISVLGRTHFIFF